MRRRDVCGASSARLFRHFASFYAGDALGFPFN
jgi:hypothetical protein